MYEGSVQDLIDELGRLPGIGPKSAQRLARAITEVKARVHFCRICWNVAEGDLCRICKDSRRDPSLVCVVEEPRDLVAIERTDRKSTRLNFSHANISYAVFCLKKKKKHPISTHTVKNTTQQTNVSLTA